MRETIDHASLPLHIPQQRLPLHRLWRNGSNDQLLGRYNRPNPPTLLS